MCIVSAPPTAHKQSSNDDNAQLAAGGEEGEPLVQLHLVPPRSPSRSPPRGTADVSKEVTAVAFEDLAPAAAAVAANDERQQQHHREKVHPQAFLPL